MMDVNIFKYHIREYVNCLTTMRNGLKSDYYLAWGKYSEAVRNKLQSLPGFEQAREKYDVIYLIQLIQGATYNFDKHMYLYDFLK